MLTDDELGMSYERVVYGTIISAEEDGTCLSWGIAENWVLKKVSDVLFIFKLVTLPILPLPFFRK